MTAATCILVPSLGALEPECERSLAELSRRGYKVRVLRGSACIDQIRCLMATEALADGFSELMWIDADIGFEPDDVDRLLGHNLPFVCGIYTKKGVPELACRLLPDTTELTLGEGGGLIEIQYAAMGFTLVRAEVFHRLDDESPIPDCVGYHGRVMRPYFLPMIDTTTIAMIDPGSRPVAYLGEDFAFSKRARTCQVAIMADTTIRLLHYGRHAYGWEDLAGVARTPGIRLQVQEKP
jgi:hypothetical protein